MNKDSLEEKLISTVKIAIKFIDTVLMQRNDTKKEVLEDYRNTLSKYLESKEKSTLYDLRKISSKPTMEGSVTDYTEGMSLQMEEQYLSLRELLIKIDELLFELNNQ